MATYYVIAGVLAVLIFGGFFLSERKTGNAVPYISKIISLVLAAVFLFRYCLGGNNVSDVLGLALGAGYSSKLTLTLSFIQHWFMFAANLLLILYPFFNARSTKAQVAFFAIPVYLVNFAFMSNHLLAVMGEAVFKGFSVRSALLAAETGIGLGYSLYVVLKERKEVLLKGKEWIWFGLGLMGIILATAPHYTLQFFFNPTKTGLIALELNVYHRILIYPIAIIPIFLYLLMKDFELETKRYVLLFYALAALVCYTYSHKFEDLKDVTAWPFHLCNTALYITPLCLTFKWKKLFYFTYFINVLGAFFAITMPNYDDGRLVLYGTVQFFRSHYQAFFMPLLTVGLGVFERPRLKQFKWSMVGFTGYFIGVMIMNAWFTNYNPSVDYFFLNSNFIAEKLGTWAENLRNIVVDFNIGSLKFVLYPAYQIPYFAVYFLLALGMWFIYEVAYDSIKGWLDIAARKKKIKLDEIAFMSQLNGRSPEEPLNMDGKDKLVLKKFTKRYGTSDVYAVKDADLEVVSGEIFGFLGPNGAGKSTIIKSIVGIQTITEGAIEVCGFDVKTQPVMAKRQIGFVPDHYALYEKLTAREYINYIADLYEVSKEDREERLNRFIELFEFQTAIDNQIKTYSHGMKQKVTIMSALIHNPKVWILDEPLTGLDPNSIFQVKECMRRHKEEGNIVFFSSHIIDVVERICDRIAIIKKGQIQCVKTVAEIEENNSTLENFYMNVIENSDVDAIKVDGEVKPA